MSWISDMWDKVKHSPNVVNASFPIASNHILGAPPALPFAAQKTYFELRIAEQFLSDKREYWNEYNPLSLSFCEFLYGTERPTFPFVVGPDLLKKVEQIEAQDRVRYLNTRVVGPTPYLGDDVTIFLGLFRMKTKDWAKQALMLLESITKTFDVTKLSAYLQIAAPVLEGINSFLGAGDNIQFRLGERNSFSDPANPGGNALAPGFRVMLRAKEQEVDQSKFWVKDNRLFFGTTANTLQPYTGSDFLLAQLIRLDQRPDYPTFDFEKEMQRVEEQIWNGEETKANFQVVLSMIARNRDLVKPHKNILMAEYRARYQASVVEAGGGAVAPVIRGLMPREDEALHIVERGTRKFNRSLEFLNHSNAQPEIMQAVTQSRERFLEQDRAWIKQGGGFKEEDFVRALNSPILNHPSVVNAEPGQLFAALSHEVMQL